MGVVFANLLTRVLLRRLEIGFHIDWLAALVALAGTAVLATGYGLDRKLSHPWSASS